MVPRILFLCTSYLLLGCLSFYGVPGPDAHQQPVLAFASLGNIKSNIFIADADGEHVRPLLKNPDRDYNPSFSADGRWIVFTSHRMGSADIYRVHPDGAGLERLTDDPAFDDQGALSPDGKFLAFVSTRAGHANIWLLEIKTKHLKNLTSGSSGDFRPAWSPNGEWIAFSSDRDSSHPKFNFVTLQSTEIYIMRRDGSDLRRITHENAVAGSPAWSADGTRVLYYLASVPNSAKMRSSLKLRGDMQIVSVSWPAGQRAIIISEPGEKWFPQWLSQSRVAYVSGGSSGGIEYTDGRKGARGEFWNAKWSADGASMIFDRETDSSWPPVQFSNSLNRGFPLLRTGVFPSFSPSGEQLVCNSGQSALLHNSILLMNSHGLNRSLIFDDPQSTALAPAWSPHGNLIAFALGGVLKVVAGKREEASAQLAVIHPDGSGLRILAAAGDHVGFPSWSPDEKKIVYRVSGGKGKGLRIIDVDTGQVTELTDGTYNDNFPAWAASGDRIAFTSDRDGTYQIYSIRPDGTEIKRLTDAAGVNAHSAWSFDGKWLAFTSTRGGYIDEALLHPYNSQPDGQIFVMQADGSNVRQLTDDQMDAGTPVWIPPGAARNKGKH